MPTAGDTDGMSARRWQIFISHSAKDNGHPTPVAGRVLETLHTVLVDRFDLFIDEKIPKGTNWREQLHAWLGQCDAAIILFDGRASRSEWVRREFEILMHYDTLRPDFFVLPLIINLEMANIEGSPFEELLKKDYEKIRTTAEDRVTSDEHKDIVATITELANRSFPGPPRGISDAGYAWIVHVANQLPKDPYVLKTAAERFGCDPNGIAAVSLGGGAQFLAGQFLNVTGTELELDGITYSVQAMRREMEYDQRSVLGELLPPVWVGAKRAHQLLPQPEASQERRLVLLPANEPETAENYISRAYYCSDFLERRVVQASGAPTGEHEEEALLDVKNAIKLWLRNKRPKAKNIYYLIIPVGDTEMQQKSAFWVHEEYPEIAVLILTGTHDISKSKRIEGPFLGTVTQLDGLDSESENRAREWVINLLGENVLKVSTS